MNTSFSDRADNAAVNADVQWVNWQEAGSIAGAAPRMGVFKLLTAKQSPDIYQPNGGSAIYVFELPD